MLASNNHLDMIPSIVVWCAEAGSRGCFRRTAVVPSFPRTFSRLPSLRAPRLQRQEPAQGSTGDVHFPALHCDLRRSWRCPASALQRYPAPRRLAGRAGCGGHNTNRLADIIHRSWSSYLDALNNWPVLTKSLTSAVLAALGDFLAQLVSLTFATSGVFCMSQLEVPRMLRFAAVNGLLVAPTFHLWYGRLVRLLPGTNFRRLHTTWLCSWPR